MLFMMPRTSIWSLGAPLGKAREGALFVRNVSGGIRHARTVRESVARETSRNAMRAAWNGCVRSSARNSGGNRPLNALRADVRLDWSFLSVSDFLANPA